MSPALPAVASTLRVQMKHTWATDADLMCRFYVQYAATEGTAAEYATFATAVATAWNSNLAAIISSQVTLVEVIVEDLTSSSAPSGTWTGSHAGTESSGTIPTSVATLLNFTIARRYRGGKPRMYLPPPGNSQLTSSVQWTSAFITAAESAWTAFIAAVVGAGWSGSGTLAQVNVSYYEGFTPFEGPTGRYRNIAKLRTAGPAIDTITGSSVNARPANQRRRLGKR
jgi:hypothetical protein